MSRSSTSSSSSSRMPLAPQLPQPAGLLTGQGNSITNTLETGFRDSPAEDRGAQLRSVQPPVAIPASVFNSGWQHGRKNAFAEPHPTPQSTMNADEARPSYAEGTRAFQAGHSRSTANAFEDAARSATSYAEGTQAFQAGHSRPTANAFEDGARSATNQLNHMPALPQTSQASVSALQPAPHASRTSLGVDPRCLQSGVQHRQNPTAVQHSWPMPADQQFSTSAPSCLDNPRFQARSTADTPSITASLQGSHLEAKNAAPGVASSSVQPSPNPSDPFSMQLHTQHHSYASPRSSLDIAGKPPRQDRGVSRVSAQQHRPASEFPELQDKVRIPALLHSAYAAVWYGPCQ